MSRFVVKLGSALLTREGLSLNQPGIADWTARLRGWFGVAIRSSSCPQARLPLGSGSWV